MSVLDQGQPGRFFAKVLRTVEGIDESDYGDRLAAPTNPSPLGSTIPISERLRQIPLARRECALATSGISGIPRGICWPLCTVLKVKKLSPAAISSLREALASIYWYKRDLRSFLRIACGKEAQGLVAQLDWGNTKVHVVSDLVDTMARQELKYQDTLIRLMLAVCDFSDFSHLRRLEDGEDKAQRAEAAVNAVRAHTATYRERIEERERAETLRELARAEGETKRRFQETLSGLRGTYLSLAGDASITPRQRGLAFEPLLRSLFELFDLDPRGPFRTTADQIDGAFSFQGGDYLLGARWQKEPVGIEGLDAFKGKVLSRLENTLGLYVSVSGFSKTAVGRHSAAQPVLILMDGMDLMAVFDDRIGLDELLLRKRRHAAQTGEVFLRASDVLLDRSPAQE